MTDKAQIPFLIRLLDDESPKVRARVVEALGALGPGLEHEIRRLGLSLTRKQKALLQQIWAPQRNAEFKRLWLGCFDRPAEEERIEAAFSLLAEYQYGKEHPVRLSALLDTLAEEFTATGRSPDPLELNHFLFTVKGLQGADTDYYNPLNSNLIYVAQERRGIPISLVSLFILVGKRLGLEIHGCNVPGHFLARARIRGMDFIFDCFSGGKLITAGELEALRRSAPEGFVEVLKTPASAHVVMARVLRNLMYAYNQCNEPEHSEFMREVLTEMQRRQRSTVEELDE